MKRIIKYSLFIGILILLFSFYYIISYYQMRLGDDILFSFYMGFKNYLDGNIWEPEERILTLKQAIEQYAQYYITFSGRITSLLQGYFFNLFGEKIISVISAFIYVGIILLIVKIGWGGRNFVKAPVILLLCSFYMFQLSATGSYINMWTITCHYSVPTLLFLLYYYIIKKTYSKVGMCWQ